MPEHHAVASVSIGTEFSSGTYGYDSTTHTTYLPLVVSLSPNERLDVSVELPFVYQSVTFSADQSSNAAAKGVVRGMPGGISNGLRVSTVLAPVATVTDGTATPVGTIPPVSSTGNYAVSGLGDIVLRGGYVLFFEHYYLPQLRTSFSVKVPTASVSDGLGTGEFDFSGGADLSKWFGNLHLAGDVSYTYQGKVADFGLKNYISYSGTIGYQMTSNLQPMLILKGETPASVYSDDLLEARARLILSITKATSIDLFASTGLSEGSPDYSGGIAAIYSF